MRATVAEHAAADKAGAGNARDERHPPPRRGASEPHASLGPAMTNPGLGARPHGVAAARRGSASTWAWLLAGLLALPLPAAAEPDHRGPEEDLGADLPPGGRVRLPDRLGNRGAQGSDRNDGPDELRDLGLRTGRDGRLVYTDGAGRFTAIIDHDGTVYFGDRYRRPHRRNRQRGRGLGRPAEGARGYNPFLGLRVGGPNEWAIRATRRDPAASAKAQFLARTEGLRRRLATAATRATLQSRLHALPDELAAIWSAPRWSPAQRRKQLFARWDECAEADRETTTLGDQADAIDRLRLDAATAARDRIERFVREHAPVGSAEAFTPDELRRLNRTRRSRRRFDPYAPAPTPEVATATVPESSP